LPSQPQPAAGSPGRTATARAPEQPLFCSAKRPYRAALRLGLATVAFFLLALRSLGVLRQRLPPQFVGVCCFSGGHRACRRSVPARQAVEEGAQALHRGSIRGAGCALFKSPALGHPVPRPQISLRPTVSVSIQATCSACSAGLWSSSGQTGGLCAIATERSGMRPSWRQNCGRSRSGLAGVTPAG